MYRKLRLFHGLAPGNSGSLYLKSAALDRRESLMSTADSAGIVRSVSLAFPGI
jgi:hypothetical protein